MFLSKATIALATVLALSSSPFVGARVLKKAKKSPAPSPAPSSSPTEGPLELQFPNPWVLPLPIAETSVLETDDFIGTKVIVRYEVTFTERTDLVCEATSGSYPLIEQAKCSLVTCVQFPIIGGCSTYQSNGMFAFDIVEQKILPGLTMTFVGGTGTFFYGWDFTFASIPSIDLSEGILPMSIGFLPDIDGTPPAILFNQTLARNELVTSTLPGFCPPEALVQFGLTIEDCMNAFQNNTSDASRTFEGSSTDGFFAPLMQVF